jgi:hypothetical protein
MGFGVGVWKTFGETFLEIRQGSDPVEPRGHTLPSAGYPAV